MHVSQDCKPYGDYRRGTVGDIKNQLINYGVPMTTVDRLSITVGSGEFDKPVDERNITLREGEIFFGRARYFEGIKQPLFYFQNQSLMDQKVLVTDTMEKKLQLRLNLSAHNTPGLVISGHIATEDLHSFISSVMNSRDIRDKRYKLVKDSGAFFQGGSGNPSGEFIYIEFWNPAGAQAFVDYINENYKFP